MFDGLREMRLATSEEVADVIYEAATDDADTLRYVVGNEDFKNRMSAQLTMPDQDYINSVKKGYEIFNQAPAAGCWKKDCRKLIF